MHMTKRKIRSFRPRTNCTYGAGTNARPRRVHHRRTIGGGLFTLFLLIGLVFLFAPQTLASKFQLAFPHFFRWPLSICRNISLLEHSEHSNKGLISPGEYVRLRNHLANVIEWLRRERQKVEQLSGFNDRPVWKGAKFVFADVITAFGGSHDRLVINRGEDDGLAKEQFVLADNAIVGTICEVGSRTAQVKLITDPTSKIAIKIAESDASVIMQGTGNGSATLQLLPTKYKIKIGDIIWARKKPGFLDSPVVTATVVHYQKDQDNPLFWDVTVKPACDMDSLKNVEVIIMNPQG
jgi:rod shape-determining protein MreC